MYDSILISDFISKDKLYKTELIECDTLWWRLADFVPYCLMLSLYCYTYRHLAAITHFIQVPCISRSRSPSIQERQSKFQNLLVWLCTITVTNPNPDTIFTLHHTEKKQVCVHLPMYADNLVLPHSHALTAAIDRYLQPAGPTAANLQQRVCCCRSMVGQTDRHRDGRTPYHDRPCLAYVIFPAYSAASAKNRSRPFGLCIQEITFGHSGLQLDLWYRT